MVEPEVKHSVFEAQPIQVLSSVDSSFPLQNNPLELPYFHYPLDSVEAQPILSFVADSPKSIIRRAHWPDRFETAEHALFNAREQLISLGGSPEVVDTLFRANGEWAHVDESGTDFLSMEPDDAFEYLIAFLQPEFAAVTTYLDEPNSPERPYNDHGELHARKVKEVSRQLLLDAGHIGDTAEEMREYFSYPMDLSPKELELCSAIAAAIHDIGYILDSETHPLASLKMAEKILPQLKANPKLYNVIKRTILLHESDNLKEEFAKHNITTPSEMIEFFEHEYPTVLSVAIADKIHQGEDRARTGKILDIKEAHTDPRSFLEDLHVEDNLLMRVKSAGWVTEKLGARSQILFRMIVDFSQDIPEGREEDFRHFAKERSSKPGQKIDVSNRTRQRFLDSKGRIEYFDSLVDVDLSIGAKRKLNAIYASFALNPFQDSADIVYQDESRQNRLRREHFTFHRDSINDDATIFLLYAEAAEELLAQESEAA